MGNTFCLYDVYYYYWFICLKITVIHLYRLSFTIMYEFAIQYFTDYSIFFAGKGWQNHYRQLWTFFNLGTFFNGMTPLIRKVNSSVFIR